MTEEKETKINYLGLTGGAEFGKHCQEGDKRLLELASANNAGPGEGRPISILPTATANYNWRGTLHQASQYFKNLGASKVEELTVLKREDGANSTFMEYLEKSALLYIPGGDPEYLYDTLVDTVLWNRAMERWRNGELIIAGSSAGAMILGSKMRRPGGDWHSAFDLLPGMVVIPHFQGGKFSAKKFLEGASSELHTVIGLSEQTTCLLEIREDLTDGKKGYTASIFGPPDGMALIIPVSEKSPKKSTVYTPGQTFLL